MSVNTEELEAEEPTQNKEETDNSSEHSKWEAHIDPDDPVVGVLAPSNHYKRWWYILFLQPVFFISALFAQQSGFRPLEIGMAIIFSLIFFVGFIAYYKDSQYIAQTESDWVPRWYLYVIGSFIFGVITPIFYLYKRYQHVKFEW